MILKHLVFATIASVAGLGNAIASPLPVPFIQGNVYANPDPCCARTNGTNISQSNPGAYASNTLNLSKAPSISATSQAMLINPNDQGSSASASISNVHIEYYFTINSADSMLVPIFVKASGFTSVLSTENYTGYNSAAAYFNVSIFSTNYLTGNITSNQVSSADKSFIFNGYYELPTNTPILVQMTAETTAGAFEQLGLPQQDTELRSAFASVDPYFGLDPSETGLSLSFSPGINNVLVSAVPLPASAPMFGLALIGLCIFGYARKEGGSFKAV